MGGVLESVRVIDWTNYQLGPLSTAMLADMGADVVKLESPGGGDLGRLTVGRLLKQTIGVDSERNFYFESFNRGKRSITLDLKQEKGREVLYRLVERSHALVTNVRRDAAAKLGADFATLSRYNPRLVYAHASGYGPKGPDARRAALDPLGVARSGMMDALAPPGVPPQWPTGAIGDQVGGTMLGYAVLAGLVSAGRSGRGQEVSTSLLGSCMWLEQLNVNATLMLEHEQPKFVRSSAGNPIYNHYECADGRWMFFALLQSDRHWPAFCAAAGVPELEHDARFDSAANREERCEELIGLLDDVFAQKTSAEWIASFSRYPDLVFDVLVPLSELGDDPQVLANGYVVDFEHPVHGPTKMVGFPVVFHQGPVELGRAAPELGAHTEEILQEVCGYSETEIAVLREENVV